MVTQRIKAPVWGLLLLLFLSTTLLPATGCSAIRLPQSGDVHLAFVHTTIPCDHIQARGDANSLRAICGVPFFLVPATVAALAPLDTQAPTVAPALSFAAHARLRFDPPPRLL
jgi:hypothetical protein